MGINDRASEAIHQFEAGKCHLNKIWPAKNHGDEILRWPIWRPRDGISLEHHAFVTFVILKHGIRLHCQWLAIMSVWIEIDCDHVRPLLEVFLAFGCEFVLMIHRPAVQITDAVENECGFRWSSS